MATNGNLPSQAFITVLNGKRCTVVPKNNPVVSEENALAFTTPSSLSSASPTSSSTSSTAFISTSGTSQAFPAAELVDPEKTIAPTAQETLPSTANPTPSPQDVVPSEIPAPDSTTAQGVEPSGVGGITDQPLPSPESTSILDVALESILDVSLTSSSAPEPTTPPEAPTGEQQSEALQQDSRSSESVAPTSRSDGPIGSATEAGLDALATDLTALEIPTAGGNAALSTGTQPTSIAPSPTAEDNAGLESPASTEGDRENPVNARRTAAVAGGVVGGLALVSLCIFLIWFWRRRTEQKRRRLTRFSGDGASGRREKEGAYFTNRTPSGPTPASEKPNDGIVYGYRRIRRGFSGIVDRSASPQPTVDLDRGTSQFGPPPASISPQSSRFSASSENATFVPGGREQFVGWWSRGMKGVSGGRPAPNPEPDFHTPPWMDEEVAVSAAGVSGTGGNKKRRSTAAGNEHFMGGLGFDFSGAANPFSDRNAIRHNSATAPPPALWMRPAKDPFSDAYAVADGPPLSEGTATYARDTRQSRGRSASADGSIYRESGASSVDFLDGDMLMRNAKFRSDPFDLDRPELLSSGTGGGGVDGSSSAAWIPPRAHVRGPSYASSYTSRYFGGESGSFDGWSDPGPDVGPAVAGNTWGWDGRGVGQAM
ncbi:hypothetical protein DL766_006041 [Monosporascus sp. MC13-8B]|uniref:Epidermal growth factor receptor-like transmembrane-juxtamembrane segment domain-containing protein n=1 Tax=Monosporascus cannonballus TaxID=155416 RepID=A0ABY0H095_9PEZI|nr:hypothetical protein DL762_008520 [Monosporascus cannonballus]RYO84932.1 hypothetical protein DL763_007302 [Monosporascus cannonballus]RYP28145.1 hypothetical protein DL766_006041 [Monosporascus sp. MC13-8B]